MIILRCLLLVFIIHRYIAEEVNLIFFQHDYDVKIDIMEVSRFNRSYAKNWVAASIPYNRTQRVLNASLELLIDIGSDLIVSAQLYKMMSNEYRFFPLTGSANVCTEYRRNAFGMRDLAMRVTNINPCKFNKGKYYINNALPDYSRFPPHMPRGSYKLILETIFHSVSFGQIDYYMRILDKPIDWKSIPKSNKYML